MVSDLVMVTAITVGGGLATILIKSWLGRLDKKFNKRFDKQDEKLDKVEKNTDGLVAHLIASKDAEIKTTGEAKKAEGKKEEKDEQAERDKENGKNNHDKT